MTIRPARAEQLRRNGLRVVSRHGDVTLTPRLLVSGETTDPFDAAILAVKGYALGGVVIADLSGPGRLQVIR